MSKFKKLIENLLVEYDRDDPSDNPWLAAKQYKQAQLQPGKLYSKPIEPLKQEDLVYIKSINTQQFGLFNTAETYLTNNKDKPYTYYKEKAYKFPISKAEEFVKKHPKEILNDNGFKYERHFELEKC